MQRVWVGMGGVEGCVHLRERLQGTDRPWGWVGHCFQGVVEESNSFFLQMVQMDGFSALTTQLLVTTLAFCKQLLFLSCLQQASFPTSYVGGDVACMFLEGVCLDVPSCWLAVLKQLAQEASFFQAFVVSGSGQTLFSSVL